MTKEAKKILIVDDDEGMGVLLIRVLKKGGYSATIRGDGQSALDWLKTNEPALMLLDIGLPDMSGQEVLESLSDRRQNIPVVIISGTDDVRLAVKLMKKGALDFVLKGANLLNLIKPVVDRTLKLLETEQELGETRSRLTDISDAINDVFWMRDANGGKILYVSPAYEEVWGFPTASLYRNADCWYDAIVEDDRSKFLRAFEAFREGVEDTFEENYRLQDQFGEIRWIRDRGYRNLDPDGRVRGISGVATDITRRKELERQVVEATERERIRIGQDLHDDLCQRLAAIKLACSGIQLSLDSEQHQMAAKVQKIGEKIGEATSLSRSIARGLSPVSMEAEGLMFALEQLAVMIEGRFEIACQFDCPELIEIQSQTCATHLFRIAQELSNNAAKHGKPKRIRIGLYRSSGGVKLEVINDGIPFHGPTAKMRGMGTRFMRFRADAIGASLDYFSGKFPDGGTRVICFVPDSNINQEDEIEDHD